MPHIYQNQPLGSWIVGGGIAWDGTNEGCRFQVSAPTNATMLGWVRPGNGYTWQTLRLYDNTGAVLGQVNAADGGTDNDWNWFPLGVPVALVPGITYTVAGFYAGARQWAECVVPANRVAPPAPFMFDDTPGYYTHAAIQMPTTAETTRFYAISVGTDYVPPPPPGEGEGDPTLTGDIGAWLSNDPSRNTHQADGLPWEINQEIGDSGDVAEANGTLFARTAFLILRVLEIAGRTVEILANTVNLMGMVADLLARIPETILTSLQETLNDVLSWLGIGPKPAEAPTIPQQLVNVEATVLQILNGIDNLQAPLEGFPTDFTLFDSIEFTECVAWPVMADVYVLHITTLPDGFALSDVCGVNGIFRAGWWAPLADTMPAGRQYIDFEFTLLIAPFGQMPGVMVQFKQGGGATLEAWRRVLP